MPPLDSADLSQVTNKMEGEFAQIQRNTVLFGLPGLFAGAVFLASLGAMHKGGDWALLSALALLAVACGVWLAARWSFILSAALLISGVAGGVLAAIFWGNISAAVCLLALPVGLACLMFGPWAGAAAAAAASILAAVGPGAFGAVSDDLRWTAVLLCWGFTGMIWLVLQPLLTAVDWSWRAYQQGFDLLDQFRQNQVRLQQALEDLTSANTQLNRLNSLANGLRQTAEEERRVKEQFVANVSHELRTPINMITGFCEMILGSPETYAGGKIPSNLLADLQVVLRNSQHLASLIDDVLDVSQIEAGQMALTKEWVSVEDIVGAVLIAVRPLYESKGLALESSIQAGLPAVFCDRTRIREVLLNLLSNAGRFTERGGVRLRVWLEELNVLFSVADTGPGIADEDRERLFQPFQQLDGSIRRKYGGTGLGLSISKSFIELHDGKMWVESRKGEGTTFFFRLPVAPAPALPSGVTRWINPHLTYLSIERSPHSSSVPIADSRPSVLVVEPGSVLQRLLRRYLADTDIQAVADLDAARARLEQSPARVVLVNAPNSFDDSASLNAAAQLPYSTPAIICSLNDQPEHDFPGDEPAEVLVKPISRDALLGALERLERPIQSILLVDDEPDAQKLFARMLVSAGRGYRVLRAGNGAQALQILSQRKIDAILLDLVMPEMDGFQFMRAREQDEALRGIPVILISARDPRGQPIVSSHLTVTRSGGLTIQQLLDSIQAVSAIITPEVLRAAPGQPGAPLA